MGNLTKTPDSFIGIGIIVGTLVGLSMDNVGLGLALGIVFGVALRAKYKNEKNENKDE